MPTCNYCKTKKQNTNTLYLFENNQYSSLINESKTILKSKAHICQTCEEKYWNPLKQNNNPTKCGYCKTELPRNKATLITKEQAIKDEYKRGKGCRNSISINATTEHESKVITRKLEKHRTPYCQDCANTLFNYPLKKLTRKTITTYILTLIAITLFIIPQPSPTILLIAILSILATITPFIKTTLNGKTIKGRVRF